MDRGCEVIVAVRAAVLVAVRFIAFLRSAFLSALNVIKWSLL